MYKYIDWKWVVAFSELKRKCFAGALCSFVLTRMVDEDASRFLEHVVHYVVVVITDIHLISACVCVFVFVGFFFYICTHRHTCNICMCYSLKKNTQIWANASLCWLWRPKYVYFVFVFWRKWRRNSKRPRMLSRVSRRRKSLMPRGGRRVLGMWPISFKGWAPLASQLAASSLTHHQLPKVRRSRRRATELAVAALWSQVQVVFKLVMGFATTIAYSALTCSFWWPYLRHRC